MPKTTVYYVNGIGNTPDDANLSFLLIKRAYKNLRDDNGNPLDLDFMMSYNPTNGFVRDVSEAIFQRAEQNPTGLMERLSFFVANAFGGLLDGLKKWRTVLLFGDYSSLIERGLDLLNGERIAIAEIFMSTYAENIARNKNQVKREHLAIYQTDFSSGKNILLIGHSQGNLFAINSLKQLTNARESIKLISVATPAANGGGAYPAAQITAYDDRIIQFIEPNNGNIRNDIGSITRDLFNHNFLLSYFTIGLPSRSKIDAEVKAALRSLTPPAEDLGLGNGPIKVTLGWGSQPDVDLHIREPSGTRVYYQNLRGESGELDRDDIDGRGPENYSVSCNTLSAGTYTVGIRYFAGNGPETATIQIRAGEAIRTFTQRLNVASAGITPTHIIATIEVSQEQGRYMFRINSR